MMRKLLVLSLFSGAAMMFGCEEKKEPTPPPTPTAPPAPTAPTPPAPTAPPADAPKGDIKGSVAFTGKAPEMAVIKMSEPACAKKAQKAEDVVVNSNGTLKNAVVRLTNVTG